MYGRKMQKILSLLLSVVAAAALIPGPAASALSSADRYYKYQWALKNDGTFNPGTSGGTTSAAQSVAGIDIDMESAWSAYTGGRPVVVALIDTGVDTANTDLSGNLWVNSDEIPGNGLDDDGNGYPDDVNGWNFRDSTNVLHVAGEDSHGTHCFGTIAAACNGSGVAGICGYTSNISVMVLKAFGGSTATGRTSDIISAIKYAQANGASIVNLSLGIDQYNAALYDVMKNSGMLFIAAAGNQGSDTAVKPMYPAAFDLDNVISVANLNYDGTLNASSNYGSSVDIAAPGTTIIGYGAENEMYYMTGTSMAAPMVTGVAALTYSFCRSAAVSDIRQIILSAAKPLASLSGKVVTGGMLDAGAAMSQAAALASAGKAAFSDVKPGDWYYKYVTELAAAGYVSGYGDGTFRPGNNVTIGEALALILTAAGNGSQPATGSNWASGYRDKAVSMGIADAAETENLNAPANRLFIARTAAKALKLNPSYGASPFTDVNDPYVTAMYDAGCVTGSFDAAGNRLYRPTASIQRSEISTIVWHMVF